MNVTRYFLQLLPVKEMTYHFSANLILSLVQKTIFPNISKVDKRYQLNVLKNKVLITMKTNAMQRVLPTDILSFVLLNQYFIKNCLCFLCFHYSNMILIYAT